MNEPARPLSTYGITPPPEPPPAPPPTLHVIVDAMPEISVTVPPLEFPESLAVTGALTDAELRATPVPVSHGGLTDTQLRATPVPVSHGGLTNTELRAAPVPVSHGGLTDTELRATPVPVSHGGLTDTQLRATPVPVSFKRIKTLFFSNDNVPAPTALTKTLFNAILSENFGAATSVSSYTVPAGKTLRINSLILSHRGHATATATAIEWYLVQNTAGPAVATSPERLIMRTFSPATANVGDRISITFPGGLDMPGDGTASFGWVVYCRYTTNAPTLDLAMFCELLDTP